MSDEDRQQRLEEARHWLVEPVGPDQVRIHVDPGESAEISEELHDALDSFVNELFASEVEGHAKPLPCSTWLECYLHECQPKTSTPCFQDVYCNIIFK